MRKTKTEIEKSLQKKYLKRITNTVKNKYKRLSESELRNKEFYFEKGKQFEKMKEIKQAIFKSFEPLIEQEIAMNYKEVLTSDSYKKALENEEKILYNVLHYRNLKEYQRFPIHIPEDFIDAIIKESEGSLSDDIRPFGYEEVQYLTLITLYAIIDYIRQGFTIKIGTMLKFLSKTRDIRVNLPDEKIECSRILEDRVIPKIELCREFGRNYFMKINENNQAILDYYREKTERFLILIRSKKDE